MVFALAIQSPNHCSKQGAVILASSTLTAPWLKEVIVTGSWTYGYSYLGFEPHELWDPCWITGDSDSGRETFDDICEARIILQWKCVSCSYYKLLLDNLPLQSAALFSMTGRKPGWISSHTMVSTKHKWLLSSILTPPWEISVDRVKPKIWKTFQGTNKSSTYELKFRLWHSVEAVEKTVHL